TPRRGPGGGRPSAGLSRTRDPPPTRPVPERTGRPGHRRADGAPPRAAGTGPGPTSSDPLPFLRAGSPEPVARGHGPLPLRLDVHQPEPPVAGGHHVPGQGPRGPARA